MKLTNEAREILDDLLEREINSFNREDNPEYRKDLEDAWGELDAIGTY